MPYIIESPFPSFNDTDGSPLNNGYVYVGSANLNPVTDPIPVYWDAALTQPAAQPIRTINGYLSRNGSPGRIYTNFVTYSFRVTNNKGEQVFSDLNYTDPTSNAGSTYQQVITAIAGQTVFTLSRTYVPGANNLFVYRNGLRLIAGQDYNETGYSEVTLTAGADNGDEFVFDIGYNYDAAASVDAQDVTYKLPAATSVFTDVEAKLSQIVSVKDFGAVGDGTTDDTAAFTAAAAYLSPVQVSVPVGTYLLNSSPVASSSVSWLVESGTTFTGAGSLTASGAKYLPLANLGTFVTVTQFGAVGDGVTDDTAAIQAAVDSLSSGGDVQLPFGTYKTTATIRVSANRTGLVFQDGAKLLPVGSFDSIRFESLTPATFIYGNRIVNGLLDETGKTGGRTLVARYVAQSNFELSSGNGYDGILLDTFNTVDLTARLTSYTSPTCDYVRAQGGASGQARSDVLRIHSLVMGGTYVDGQDGLVIDGFVHTVAGSHVYAINVGGKPLHALNSVAASDIPTFLTFFDFETDYCKNSVYLQTCQVVELVACTINGAREDHGVFVASGCIDARINGGRFTGNKLAGIAVANAGTIIRGAKLAANSSNVAPVTGTLNTYPGILVGGTSSGVVVTGCRSGDAASSTFQRHGIQIDTGATNFIVSNNDVRDNATSGIADGSTATNGYVINNNGYTGTLSAFVAGASPYTYRAGHSAESVYVYGGTVTSIALGGATVFSTTNQTITLGPNQTVVITHTAAPTILKMPQ